MVPDRRDMVGGSLTRSPIFGNAPTPPLSEGVDRGEGSLEVGIPRSTPSLDTCRLGDVHPTPALGSIHSTQHRRGIRACGLGTVWQPPCRALWLASRSRSSSGAVVRSAHSARRPG